jgi:hypothetical protein
MPSFVSVHLIVRPHNGDGQVVSEFEPIYIFNRVVQTEFIQESIGAFIFNKGVFCPASLSFARNSAICVRWLSMCFFAVAIASSAMTSSSSFCLARSSRFSRSTTRASRLSLRACLSSHWSIAILAFTFCSIALCNASLHLGLGYNHKPGVRVYLHQSSKVSRVLNDDPIAALGAAMDNNYFTSDVLSDYSSPIPPRLLYSDHRRGTLR